MLIVKDNLTPMKNCPWVHGKINPPRTIVDGCSKLYSLWVHRSEYSSYDVFMFLKNNADHDENPYFAAFHLGLHCLPITHLDGSSIQRIQQSYEVKYTSISQKNVNRPNHFPSKDIKVTHFTGAQLRHNDFFYFH